MPGLIKDREYPAYSSQERPMGPHVCPWWGGYFIDNRFRRLLHKPEVLLSPYVQPGMTALDFGCGMGFFAIPLARALGETGRVVAVDLQQQMLDVLQKRAAKAGVAERIDTHRCRADALGYHAPVDFILAFYSVHEVPEPRNTLTELSRCLCPQGRLLIVEPVGHVSGKQFDGLLGIARELGLAVEARPRVRWSRAALLSNV